MQKIQVLLFETLELRLFSTCSWVETSNVELVDMDL